MYIGAGTPVSAKLQLHNPSGGRGTHTTARAILDSGSQCTYITSRMRKKLQLPTGTCETLRIKTFGATEGRDTACEVVDIGVRLSSGEPMKMSALVVPFICDP